MGLDIYTYRTKNFDEYKKFDKIIDEADKVNEDEWSRLDRGREYEEIPEAEREKISASAKKVALEYVKERGIDVDGKTSTWDIKNPHKETVDETSKVHPEHELFRVGYFRSSYNGSGINHILEDRIGITLYDIFQNNSEDYDFIPDWEDVKERALKARDDLKQAYEDIGNITVIEVNGYNREEQPQTTAEALAQYKSNLDSNKNNQNSFNNYSNSTGLYNFSESPYKVRAVIPGTSKYGFVKNVTYLVIEQSQDTVDFYLQALDIIAETADLALSDKEHVYFLGWSG